MNNTATTTTTREQELAAVKALEAIMFEAQDVWGTVDYIGNTPQAETYRLARLAFLTARSAWINS